MCPGCCGSRGEAGSSWKEGACSLSQHCVQLVRQERGDLPVLSLCTCCLLNHHSTKWHVGSRCVVSVIMTKHFLSAGKSKKEDGVKEDKRKRDSSTQPPKSSKSSTGSKSSQQPTAPQQAPSGQPQQGAFVAHKEIKLTLLNKVRPWAHLVRAPGSHVPSAHPGTETKWGPSGHLNLVARYHPCSSACLDGQPCGKQRGMWA